LKSYNIMSLLMAIISISIQMNPVAEHKWEERVLIVTASSPSNIGYKRQDQLLTKGKKGMKERDLIIYRLYNDHWLDPSEELLTKGQADAMYRAYDIDPGTFSVVLIGKDGTVKMRKSDIVSTRELFQLIDSMPMRQQEMKKQKEPDN